MQVLDPGHSYLVDSYDGGSPQRLDFMKREGAGYPGNVGTYPGTNLQELLRVCVDRLIYLNNQRYHRYNGVMIYLLRRCLVLLELRAAENHGHLNVKFPSDRIEELPTCTTCGHIQCKHTEIL